MIKDKEPDEVKKIFHIDADITPEEEKMVRENNMWVFELGEKKPEAAKAEAE
jgi:S-phase kinase-associated protein 1